MPVIYRSRNLPKPFNEYLLVPVDGELSIPPTVPSRYESRIKLVSTFQGIYCIQVESSWSEKCLQITRKDITRGNGVWIVASDCEDKGAFGDVPGITQFMSVLIQKESASTILQVEKNISSSFSPMSLYHGTANQNIESILEGGLLPTNGMLGHAIYLGTLWKAARFAIMSQEYALRKGCVFRVLAFPSSTQIFPRADWSCKCMKCDKDPWAASIADHSGTWQLFYECAHARPTAAFSGACRDGSQKFILKNDEWALSPSASFITTHIGEINVSTISGPHHDPLYRGISIS